MSKSSQWSGVAESAWGWVLDQVRWGDDGPVLPLTVQDGRAGEPDEFPDSTHSGLGGLAFVLAEILHTRAWTQKEGELAAGIITTIRGHVPDRSEPSYGFGLAGDATALRLLDPGAEEAALQRLRDLQRGDGWTTTLMDDYTGPLTDLLLGNAGVVLTAMWTDHSAADELVAAACDVLVGEAVEDESGLRWYMGEGYPMEMPNYSHGAAGVAAALATAGHRYGRSDWLQAAVRGAEHVIAVSEEAGRSELGLMAPHVIPHLERHDFDPYTWNWCHGPAGTSYLFLALHQAEVTAVSGRPPLDWHAACMRALETSGIPQRLEPGFWDNDGRCCGTAGSGDAVLDAAQYRRDDEALAGRWMGFVDVLADAVVERAVTDENGTRWQFVEHRVDPPLLPPGTGWMQGAAGIAAFLLRAARVRADGLDAPVVTRPDAMWPGPAQPRTVT